MTRKVDIPTSSTDAVTVTLNGLLQSSASPDGLTATYAYDDLGRPTGIADPRTGTSMTNYDAQGRVATVQDAASQVTTYTYDATTGRRIEVEDALGKKEFAAYNERGQVVRKWGDTTYPLEYVYDTHGRMTELHTYRGGTAWSGPTWPADPGTADVTTWTYDSATGLVTVKTHPDGDGTTYTYDAAGRALTRTWTREVDQVPVSTTYSYGPKSGNLLGVSYSDGTTSVGYSVSVRRIAGRRLGRQDRGCSGAVC